MTNELVDQETHVRAVLSSQRFLNMEGLVNEVPFFIWAYPPELEIEANEAERRIRKTLQTQQVPFLGRSLEILKIDLYDLAIDILKDRKMLDRVEDLEPKRRKTDFRRDLQKMLDPEHHIIPAIKKRINESGSYDILFLTGIGHVFPFIRSHNVLNTLQSVASGRPMLMFFPGEYRQSPTLGSALVLFGKLPDDQYYRAKNILEQEL
jgi:hypothetical protein